MSIAYVLAIYKFPKKSRMSENSGGVDAKELRHRLEKLLTRRLPCKLWNRWLPICARNQMSNETITKLSKVSLLLPLRMAEALKRPAGIEDSCPLKGICRERLWWVPFKLAADVTNRQGDMCVRGVSRLQIHLVSCRVPKLGRNAGELHFWTIWPSHSTMLCRELVNHDAECRMLWETFIKCGLLLTGYGLISTEKRFPYLQRSKRKPLGLWKKTDCRTCKETLQEYSVSYHT